MSESIFGESIKINKNSNSHLVTLGNGDQVISLLNPNAREFVPTSYAEPELRRNYLHPQSYSDQNGTVTLPLPAGASNFWTGTMTTDCIADCILASPVAIAKEAPSEILNSQSHDKEEDKQEEEENLSAKALIKKWSERIKYRKEDDPSIFVNGASSKFGPSMFSKKPIATANGSGSENEQLNAATDTLQCLQEQYVNANSSASDQANFSNQLEQLLDDSQLVVAHSENDTKIKPTPRKRTVVPESYKVRSKDEKKDRKSVHNKIHKVRATPPYTTWSEMKKLPLQKLAMHCKSKYNNVPWYRTLTKTVTDSGKIESTSPPVAHAECAPKYIVVSPQSSQSVANDVVNSKIPPSSEVDAAVGEEKDHVDNAINVWPYVSYRNWSEAPMEIVPKNQQISMGGSTFNVWPIATYKKWSDAPENVTENPKHFVTSEATVNLYPIATYQKWSEVPEEKLTSEHEITANNLQMDLKDLQKRANLCTPKHVVSGQPWMKQPDSRQTKPNPLLEAYQKWMHKESEKLSHEISVQTSFENQQPPASEIPPTKMDNSDNKSTKAFKPYLQEFIEDLRKRIVGDSSTCPGIETAQENILKSETPANMVRLINPNAEHGTASSTIDESTMTENFKLTIRPSNPRNVPKDSDETKEQILKLFMGPKIETPPSETKAEDDAKKIRPPSVIEKDLEKVAELLEEIKIAQIADDMGDFVNAEDLEVQRIFSNNVSEFDLISDDKLNEGTEITVPVERDTVKKLPSGEKMNFFGSIQINKVSDSSLSKVVESATTTTLHSKVPPVSPIDKRLLDGIPPLNIRINDKPSKPKKTNEKKLLSRKSTIHTKKEVHIMLPTVKSMTQSNETACASGSSCTTSSKSSSGFEHPVARAPVKTASSHVTSSAATRVMPKTVKKPTTTTMSKSVNPVRKKAVPPTASAPATATANSIATTAAAAPAASAAAATATGTSKTTSATKKKVPPTSLTVKTNTTTRLRSMAANKATVASPPVSKISLPPTTDTKKTPVAQKSIAPNKSPVATADKGTSTTKIRRTKKPQIRDTLSSVLRQSEANKRRHLFLTNEANDKDNILVNDYLFK